jgi:hypothetical protein
MDKAKFRFRSEMTFGGEAKLGGGAKAELHDFLRELFVEFGNEWQDHPKIKIEAEITAPFSFKDKRRMKNGMTAAAFYAKLSAKLNQLMPTADTDETKPGLKGIIIIQEDGGGGPK